MATIEIDEQVQTLLTTAAASRKLTPSQLASSLLRDALADGEAEWNRFNQRRIDLIRKGNRQELSEVQQAELQQLQNEADQRVEKSDLALLDTAKHLCAAVESLR